MTMPRLLGKKSYTALNGIHMLTGEIYVSYLPLMVLGKFAGETELSIRVVVKDSR